jgi:sirohydrochlorin ferrochelatase
MSSRLLELASLIIWVLAAACASTGGPPPPQDTFGVLVMAHGGSDEWNQAVLEAVKPLHKDYRVEVAFGMADASTIQESVSRLEATGVEEIGVVRLFISGESWYERTQQILGLTSGAPAPDDTQADHEGHGGHHMPSFWRIDTQTSFALSSEGLGEAAEMDRVLAERVRSLSHEPAQEDVLILAHGPGDDQENERWIAEINERTVGLRRDPAFRRIEVMTLREDWPEKREEAEARIRAFVTRAGDEGGEAIVVPFRVYGFGPYEEVLEGLEFRSDGRGLIPHAAVSLWLNRQADAPANGPFRETLD